MWEADYIGAINYSSSSLAAVQLKQSQLLWSGIFLRWNALSGGDCGSTCLSLCCHLLVTRLGFGCCDVELVLVESESAQELIGETQPWGTPGTSSYLRVSVEPAGAIFEQRHRSAVRLPFGRTLQAGVWMPSHRQGLCWIRQWWGAYLAEKWEALMDYEVL